MSRRAPGQLVHDVQVALGLAGQKGYGAEVSALAMLHEAGLTLPQVVVLSILQYVGQSQVTTLAEALGMSMSATSSLVQRLVECDLVTRTEDRNDRRNKHIELTRAGAALIDRVSTQRAAEVGRGVATLPAPLRADLLDVLERVIDHLRTCPPREPA